jgi:uncharacterized protein
MTRIQAYWCWAAALAVLFAVGPGQAQAQKSDSKAKVTATAEKPGADGKQVVTVTMDIEPGWHAYANPVGSDDLVPSQTKVTIESKNKLEDVQIEYPPGKEVRDKSAESGKYYSYEGKVTIKATVKRAPGDSEPLTVKVRFQTCTDKECLMIATVELKDVKPQ